MKPVKDIDVLSDQFNSDPMSVIRPYLEREEPILYAEYGDRWIIFKHSIAKEALSHPDLSKDRRYWKHFQMKDNFDLIPNLSWMLGAGFLGPETHADDRRLVNTAFSPRALRRIEDEVKDVVNETCRLMLAGGTVDFAEDITRYLPYSVISKMLGVDQNAEDFEAFRHHAMNVGHFPDITNTPEKIVEIDQSVGYVRERIERMLQDRKENPCDDLLNDFLVAAEETGIGATDSKIAAAIMGLIGIGSSGLKRGIDLAVYGLLTHPEEFEKLKADRGLLDNAVNELLRFQGPSKLYYRFVARDTELAGQKLNKGEAVVMVAYSLNRDQGVFENADDLDISRNVKASLHFGHGRHFCIGANLARMQIKHILGFILDHVPDASVDLEASEIDSTDALSFAFSKLMLNTGL